MFGFLKSGRKAIRRILVVEDEPLLAFDNEHLLGDAGFEVVATVDTAAEASCRLSAGGIDLVISDVRLSGTGTGIDVARAAKALDVPVLFVTGNCPPEAETLAIGCLAKPYAARDLLAAIAAVSATVDGERPKKVPRGLTLFQV